MNSEEKLELMKTMFNPKSVAVLGATDQMMKIGSMVLMSTLACGYTKEVYPINPNPKYSTKKILGLDVYPSLDKCPKAIDIAAVVVPPNAVVDSIKQAVENDIRTAAIITAGFGEVKTEERQQENKDLVKVANKGGLIFVGPNSMGLYSSEDKTSPLHLGFGFMMPKPGNYSIVSQSGTMGTIFCNALQGIRYFVSSGNEASLTLEDYLEFYAQDEGTKVIGLFAEGLRAGSRFKEICTETTKKKPIVFLKTGLTKSGARAANSHTGSIAGSLDIYKSVFKQTGVIFTDQIMEFIYLMKGAKFLLPLPSGDPLRAGIISGGGGFVVHLSDLCDRHGLEVVNLNTTPNGQKLIKDISEILPFYWSKNNPVDLVATGNPEVYKKVTELMLNSGCFDVLITMTNAGLADRIAKMEPDNEFGARMKQMMMAFAGDRFKSMARNEIKMSLNNPNTKVVYVSFDPRYPDEIYDQNEVLVIGGSPEIAAIVLKKLHDYQNFVDTALQNKKEKNN